jgi:hypothetical protein
VSSGGEEGITPGKTLDDTRRDYDLADGTRVVVQGPRQGNPASRLEALREAIALAEAELAGREGDTQAAA